jgi:hypothetical protein
VDLLCYLYFVESFSLLYFRAFERACFLPSPFVQLHKYLDVLPSMRLIGGGSSRSGRLGWNITALCSLTDTLGVEKV